MENVNVTLTQEQFAAMMAQAQANGNQEVAINPVSNYIDQFKTFSVEEQKMINDYNRKAYRQAKREGAAVRRQVVINEIASDPVKTTLVVGGIVLGTAAVTVGTVMLIKHLTADNSADAAAGIEEESLMNRDFIG